MSVLLKFNAGRVSYDENTKLCTPHPMKGEISVRPSDEEGFYEFVWSPRENSTGVEIESFLVIPGDVVWKQVSSCSTGRVFTLTFLSSGAKNLYWLQDIGDDDDLSKLTSNDVKICDTISKLLGDQEEEPEPHQATQPQVSAALQPIYEISDVITPSLIGNYINSLPSDQLEKFYEYLPPSIPHTRSDLLSVLRSGFFAASSNKLSSALKNGAGGVVSRSLKYDYNGEGIVAFLNAVRNAGLEEKKK